MNENNTQNIEQQPTNTPTPEASGDQGGEKLFTQADLDRIIGERLARERAKVEPSPDDAREADMRAREARLTCREFIASEGYPAKLLDILDTTDGERFKDTVQKLDELLGMPSNHRKPRPHFITGGDGGGHSAPRNMNAMLEAVFSPPKI